MFFHIHEYHPLFTKISENDLQHLAIATDEKRTRQVMLYPNACWHTTNIKKLAITKLGWKIIEHPPYCPDIVSSNFHHLPNNLQGVCFDNEFVLPNGLTISFI